MPEPGISREFAETASARHEPDVEPATRSVEFLLAAMRSIGCAARLLE
jgi:hypothetical protein